MEKRTLKYLFDDCIPYTLKKKFLTGVKLSQRFGTRNLLPREKLKLTDRTEELLEYLVVDIIKMHHLRE
jgi:hypothetical protein